MPFPAKKAKKIPRAKNGPKGILLLSVKSFPRKSNKKTAIIAPSQKDNKTAEIPATGPNNQPAPRASLASPKPIQRPFDINHSEAKKTPITIPAKNLLVSPEFLIKSQLPKSQTKEKKERAMKG